MDIISEILETDRLAEEKLEQAMQKRGEMLAECEKQAERMISDARTRAEQYRSSLANDNFNNDPARELKASEQTRLSELAEAYENNHEAWENEIVAAITG